MTTIVPIVSADDCLPCAWCGELWCALHGEHYADCPCIGPHSAEDEGYRLEERDGKLVGVKD